MYSPLVLLRALSMRQVNSMHLDRRFEISFRTQQFLLLAAEEGSFHKAAKILKVSHTVLLRSVENLERDLGGKIFKRNRNQFSVTRAGELFLDEIRQATNHVKRGWDLAQHEMQISKEPFRIGYSPLINSKLLPLLEEFLDKNPAQVPGDAMDSPDVVLETGCTAQLICSVLHGKVDAALVVQPIEEDDLWITPVARESWCIALSKNHPFAKRTSLSIRDLDRETVFFLPRSAHPGLYDRTVRYIESTGACPVLREVLSFTHTMEVVAHNFGIALLPHSASAHVHMGVVFKPVSDRLLWLETAVVARRYLRDERLQEGIQWLLLNLHA